MTQTTINQTVTISALGFKKNLEAYPKRMEYEGGTYNFIDAGLRCAVRSGQKLSQIITVSDGQSWFRLRNDNQRGDWVLLSISS